VASFGLTQSAAAQGSIALVDVGKVLKNHPVFDQQLQSLRAEAEQFKAQTQAIQQQLQQEAQSLRGLDPASDQFKSEESRLAQKSAAKEVEQRNAMRELVKREARLHYDTYQEVQGVIADYCSRKGIPMAMRFNSIEMDKNKPAVIMQKVNGAVVFHNRQWDITNDIMTQIVQMKAASRDIDNNRR
jgi:Skp family chaperone for outer membrane proteins